MDYNKAHDYSSNHRTTLVKDKICGCFYCLRIFSPSEIVDWIEDNQDDTAICPYCGVDSVIGQSSGFTISKEFLEKMQNHWFVSARYLENTFLCLT